MRGLSLEVSMGKTDSFDGLDATYRKEGISLAADHMRLYGIEIPMEVLFTDLILGRKLGQGACSSVYAATHRTTGEQYAVKMFNVYDKNQEKQLIREISLLTQVQCDALISFKGAFHEQGSIGIIIEYMDRGSLEFMLDRDVQYNENVLAAVIYQILWGLGYLHFDKRVHRDVKPANILLNSRGEVKISDFGIISRELRETTTGLSNTSVGTFKYMSPERLVGDKYNESGDIWSVGVMMLQLWTKTYPFGEVASPIDLISELETINLEDILAVASPPDRMREVVRCMLVAERTARWGCQDLLELEWFSCHRIQSIDDAHRVVASWLRDLESSPKRALPDKRYLETKGGGGGRGGFDEPVSSSRSGAGAGGIGRRSEGKDAFYDDGPRRGGPGRGRGRHSEADDDYDDDFEPEEPAYDPRNPQRGGGRGGRYDGNRDRDMPHGSAMDTMDDYADYSSGHHYRGK